MDPKKGTSRASSVVAFPSTPHLTRPQSSLSVVADHEVDDSIPTNFPHPDVESPVTHDPPFSSEPRYWPGALHNIVRKNTIDQYEHVAREDVLEAMDENNKRGGQAATPGKN
jgi:hypothetical protein